MLELLIEYLRLTVEAKEYFAKVHGLASLVEQDGKRFPAAYTSKGDYKRIDLEPSAFYFRKRGEISRTQSEEDGGTGCDDLVTITVPLTAVAYAPKDIFKTDNAYADERITWNISNVLELANYNSLRTAMKADDIRCFIRSVSDDRYGVWSREHRGIDMAARHENIYCYVDFDVQVTINSSCLTNFECSNFTVEVNNGEITVSVTDTTAWHQGGDTLPDTTTEERFGSLSNHDVIVITNGVDRWTFGAADGHLIPQGAYNIGSAANPIEDLYVNTLHYNIPIPNVVQTINGDDSNDQFLVVGSSGADFNISTLNGTHTFNIPTMAASGVTRGLLNNGVQSIPGQKTFTSIPIIDSGTSSRLALQSSGANVGQFGRSGTAIRILAETGFYLSFVVGNTIVGGFATSNNLIIGADAGGVSGSGKTHIRGAGATDTTSSLYVENSALQRTFRVYDEGSVEQWSAAGYYFGDKATDGTWRIIRSGNNLVFQRRESGSYVTKSTITP